MRTRIHRGGLGALLWLLASALLAGCLPEGATEFVSADPDAGASVRGLPESIAFSEDASLASDDRSIEEGDIYRVFGDAKLLNLNSWRGLQVIDLADVDAPEIIGTLRESGYPVELYVLGDRAIVLLNYVTDYYATPGEPEVEMREGSVVLLVDLSDPTTPTVLDRVPVTAGIRTSRLSTWQGQTALYLVSNGWARWRDPDGTYHWESRNVLQSIEVTDGGLERRTELDLGTYVTALQATNDALLVARHGEDGYRQTTVSVVDIGDPGGVMVEGDTVDVAGRVWEQFQLDLTGGVLRVVSGGSWNGVNTLETFDASDIQQITPVDRASFGEGERLFATLFLPDRAFFVTYLRVDPFHAFEIEPNGTIHERAEFIVSGWNDYFRAVRDDRRLIGIGVDDAGGFGAAVSLYDITDLSNPSPLIARARVEGSNGWSEARWDHRAFSVLEDSVSVEAPDDTLETGLVLLPFSSWRSETSDYHNGVQILTFSDDTLTLRGRMEHDDPVRRSFQPATAQTANLSNSSLALFDTTSPDDPQSLGTVALTTNYPHVLVYGDHVVRIESANQAWAWYWEPSPDIPSEAQVIPAGADPDTATPVATFPIRAGARPYVVGDLLVTVDTKAVGAVYETTIEVHDLSDPTDPSRVGSLVTAELEPAYPWYFWGGCFACDVAYFAPYPIEPEATVVEHGLVFLQREWRSASDEDPAGKAFACPWSPCYRDWQRFSLYGLDVTEPTLPQLSERLDLSDDDEGTSLLGDGDGVWVSLQRPEAELHDGRPCVRHFIQRVDFSVPSRPLLDGEPINVPGELFATAGEEVFTRDRFWLGDSADHRISRLRLEDGMAVLEASRTFAGKWLTAVKLDGAGTLLAQYHGSGWTGPKVAVMDAGSEDLDVQALLEVPGWGTLFEVLPGRAIFQVSGGLLLYDLDDPGNPLPLAQLAIRGWALELAQHARTLFVAAGVHGAYALDLDTFDLPPPPD